MRALTGICNIDIMTPLLEAEEGNFSIVGNVSVAITDRVQIVKMSDVQANRSLARQQNVLHGKRVIKNPEGNVTFNNNDVDEVELDPDKSLVFISTQQHPRLR